MAEITITTQPVSTVVNKNETATLTVVATSGAVLTYSWFDNSAQQDALQTGPNSFFTPAPSTESKDYIVKISAAGFSTVISNVARLIVIDIVSQPIGTAVNKNRTTTLSVDAITTATAGTLVYSWHEIPTTQAQAQILLQTGTSKSFAPLPLTLLTNYIVKISSTAAPVGFIESDVVTITVIDPPVISIEPIAVSVNLGKTATLSVVVATSPNASAVEYQWYIGASGITSNPVVGAVGFSHVVPNVQQSTNFWVQIKNDAGFVNSNSARVTVIEPFVEDSIAIREEKSNAFGNSLGNDTNSLLAGFPLNSIKVLSQAQSLADCAKNLPNRLKNMAMEIAIKKAEELLQDTTGVTFADLQKLKDKYDAVQRVVDGIQNLIPKKPTLIEAISLLKNATGIDLIEKTNKVLNDFAAVGGISDIVEQALNSDFCKITNYGIDGRPAPSPTNIPMGIPPSSVEGVAAPVGIFEFNTNTKDEYDSFIFQLKEYIEADPSTDETYKSSISYLHTIALAYHDKISKTVDDTNDSQIRGEFEASIADTVIKNPSWSEPIITEFKNRGSVISDIINRNAQVIRNFYNPSGSGDWMEHYMSAYGHVKADDGSSFDKTTENDIAKGAIKEDWQYLGNRNNKLVKGTSVASNYFKHGTVLEIRFADSKAPVGSGRVRVDDSGGMSKNVLDYFCAGDRALFKSITSGSKNQGSKTKPRYTTPIEVKVVSGGPK